MMKGGLGNLMKQAQQMQENMRNMQEQLAKMEVEGQSGAGMVKVVMTCRHDVKRVSIDDSLIGDDKEMLVLSSARTVRLSPSRPQGAAASQRLPISGSRRVTKRPASNGAMAPCPWPHRPGNERRCGKEHIGPDHPMRCTDDGLSKDMVLTTALFVKREAQPFQLERDPKLVTDAYSSMGEARRASLRCTCRCADPPASAAAPI